MHKERVDTMRNYGILVKQLKEKDKYIIPKLAIYHELSSLTYIEELSAEDITEIIEYLHNVYLGNELNYQYPKIAKVASELCHFDLQELLLCIRKDDSRLEQQILDKLFFI